MNDYNNTSLHAPLLNFIKNEAFFGQPEHLELIILYAGFFELDKSSKASILGVLNKLRASDNFEQDYLELLLGIYNSKISIEKTFDQNMSELLDRSVKDEVASFYDLTDIVHTKGYLSQEK